MATAPPTRATLDDLYRVNGKAELIGGFIEGAPTFAVEVRGENDYSPSAEREMAARRADYFEAGTLAVWDVDPEAEVIRAYRADAPDQPATYGRGAVAEAEPAVPGWRLAVDAIF